jgi:very-short-patch-repair endonuclease
VRLEGTERAWAQARALRRGMTPPEIALWLALRRNGGGLRFRRQYSAGPYILDFYCAPARLAIEVDGEAHERGHRPARDAVRDRWLADRGVRVLRYAARDVLREVEGVVAEIVAAAAERARNLGSPVLPLRQAAPATSPWRGRI